MLRSSLRESGCHSPAVRECIDSAGKEQRGVELTDPMPE